MDAYKDECYCILSARSMKFTCAHTLEYRLMIVLIGKKIEKLSIKIQIGLTDKSVKFFNLNSKYKISWSIIKS